MCGFTVDSPCPVLTRRVSCRSFVGGCQEGKLLSPELHHRLQRGQRRFFIQFLMVYSRFCSAPFASQYSLKPVFPCVPRLSVAVYVVRHRCSTYLGLARPQLKKVVKVKLVCLKRLQSNGNLRKSLLVNLKSGLTCNL